MFVENSQILSKIIRKPKPRKFLRNQEFLKKRDENGIKKDYL